MTLWPNGSTSRPTISSPYGPRKVTIPGASSVHRGVDTIGYSTIHAVEAGRVVHVGWRPGWEAGGLMVWIQHDGFVSRNLHMASASVREGQTIPEGQPIGAMGNTGINGGVHHHLEIVVNGSQIDPVPFITARIGSAPAGTEKPTAPEKEEDMTLKLHRDTERGSIYFVDEFGADHLTDYRSPDIGFEEYVLAAQRAWDTEGLNARDWDITNAIAQRRWDQKRAQIVDDVVAKLAPLLKGK
jgi:hypothetical protein